MDFFIYILISWNATHDNTKEKNISASLLTFIANNGLFQP